MNNKFLEKLNKEQKKAVIHQQGPLLIVAGAGTGKTLVLTCRIVYLIESKKAKPEEILGLTFTDKAAGEMEERVDKALSYSYADLWISTFHSFCERILRNHSLDIGLASDFKLVDTTDAWLLMRQNLDKLSLNYYRPRANPSKFIHPLINHFSRCKDDGIYPEDYLKYSDDLKMNFEDIAIKNKSKEIIEQERERVKEIAEAYHFYQQLLLKNNILDFGDLINYCLKLFKERPLILEKYRQQFKYILIDEFQDTNWSQYELIKLLAAPQNNLAVCGDDDQSVYQWRGASFNNVLQFRKDFPQQKEIILTTNYRSFENILSLAYNFIQFNNPNRLEYQLNKIKELSEKAQKKGIDLGGFKKIDKKLKAIKKGKGIIDYLYFRNSEEEAQGVVEQIIAILKKDKKISFNDFAILVRTNEHANIFSRALERNNLPYQFLALKGLYSKPIILDIISYFKLLDNYHESSAVFRVLNLPFLKIPYEDISKITYYSFQQTQSIYESLKQIVLIPNISQSTAVKINELLGLIQKHANLAQKRSVSEVLVRFLEDSGYLNYLVKSEKGNNREEIDLINQFYDKIKKFEESQLDSSLNGFMKQLQLEIESGEQGSLEFDTEKGPEMIKIMTIHSAKGLEFDYVFLVNLVDKRFPTTKKKDPIEIPEKLVKEVVPEGDVHLQEERRLFYVGMTRAKKGLFLTSAENYGGVRKKMPSRFLLEAEIISKNKGEEKHQGKKRKISGGLNNLKENSFFRGLCHSTVKSSAFFDKIKQFNEQKIQNLPPYFSFSQLAVFKKCPLQYKFSYIFKIPIKGKAVFSFGKTMHNTLFEFVKLLAKEDNVFQGNLLSSTISGSLFSLKERKSEISFKKLLAAYKRNWINEWYESEGQKKDYYQSGKKSLRIFYDDFIKTEPKIKIINNQPALEQDFKILIGPYIFKGKIDRIDELKNNEAEIIDYKTGKVGDDKLIKKEEKKQLLIYQIAAEKALGIFPSKLTYHYLEDGTKVSFLGTNEEKEELEKEIIKEIEKIKKGNFYPSPGWQCDWCDYKEICEHRK